MPNQDGDRPLVAGNGPPDGNPPAQPTWLEKMSMRELDDDMRGAYLWFAMALLLLLGTQNMIQPATTSTFINSVAYNKIPVAQTYLPLVYLPVLFLYNFLFNTFRATPVVVITIMCLLYAVIYGFIAVQTIMVYDWSKHTEGVLGVWEAWFFWFASNTKSVLFPVMFWSIMNDISARKNSAGVGFSRIAYGTLVFGGQIGGIVGSAIASNNQHLGGTIMLLVVQALALLLVPFMMFVGFRKNSSSRANDRRVSEETETEARQVETGCAAGAKNFGKNMYLLVDGLWLILTHPVLLGIFWIAAAHLIPRVILDYQGTGVVKWKWPARHGDDSPIAQHNKQLETSFFGYCNLTNNIGTMLLSFLGLRAIVDKGGLVVGLLVTPLISLIAVLAVCFCGDEESMTRFWVVQIVLVFVNVVQYALNGPCREMLYVRCNKDIKYKAKSWADMYGNIMQKTIAAQINLKVNKNEFNGVVSGIIVCCWVSVWVCIAAGLGLYHTTLEKNELTIGENDIGKWPFLKDEKPKVAPNPSQASSGGISIQQNGEDNKA